MLNKARIAVLVSGGGTNLEALFNAQAAGALPHGEIVAVVSSNPDAFALERARRRCFVESHYFNPVQSRVEDERLYIKPAGEYAVYYHQGELEDLEVAFHHFVDEVERQGYQLCGDVYEDDLVEELLLSQTALSVARLTARVERADR